MENREIIISEGKRPFWHVCVAALAFLFAGVVLFNLILNLYSTPTEGSFRASVNSLEIVIFAFVIGIRFSIIQSIHFNLISRKYKNQFSVGPVNFGRWIDLPQIEYISVFRQAWSHDKDRDGDIDATGHNYDVNVWHGTSKHFTIYSNEELEPAFEMARHLAIKLQVDLLDATVPNDFKWVELENTAKEQTA